MGFNTLILFDLDGTIVSSFADIRAALNSGLEKHGFPSHDIETVKSFVGNGIVKLVERAMPAGTPPERTREVLADVRKYYAEHPADHASFFPGMKELVARLAAAGHGMALISNKPDNLVQEMADAMGFRPFFGWIQGERDGVPIKPDPGLVRSILQESGADRAIMVGDGLPDGEVARAARIGFVGVSWGVARREDLEAYGPVANSDVELEALIAEALRGL